MRSRMLQREREREVEGAVRGGARGCAGVTSFLPQAVSLYLLRTGWVCYSFYVGKRVAAIPQFVPPADT